eukprot:7227446-Heterocapsa_arctica.AAC.1
MPPAFFELTDDYALAVLMMWTYVDLYTARVHRIHPPNLAARIFDMSWLQYHLPEQRVYLMTARERAWLCPWICDTCRLARLNCPACRMKIRDWPLPASGGGLATDSFIKDYPPCGSGQYLLPRAREGIVNNWLQDVRSTIEAHHATEIRTSGAP